VISLGLPPGTQRRLTSLTNKLYISDRYAQAIPTSLAVKHLYGIPIKKTHNASIATNLIARDVAQNGCRVLPAGNISMIMYSIKSTSNNLHVAAAER